MKPLCVVPTHMLLNVCSPAGIAGRRLRRPSAMLSWWTVPGWPTHVFQLPQSWGLLLLSKQQDPTANAKGLTGLMYALPNGACALVHRDCSV